MELQNMGYSKEVTGGIPIETPKNKGDVGELQRIISQLGVGTHYIENPKQAIDMISLNADLISQRNDNEFYSGILYILGEYLRGDREYNINGVNNTGTHPNDVDVITNRKGIISKQVLQVLQDPDEYNYPIDIYITEIDYQGISKNIVDFVVGDASPLERRKVQVIKNILLSRLGLSEMTDWTVILGTIKNKFSTDKQNEKTA